MTSKERLIILFCVLVSVADGFDTLAIAYAGPAIRTELNFSAGLLGAVFSAGLVGGMFGALPAAYIERKIGRRSLLLLCLLWFSAGAILTALTASAYLLVAVRFFSGMGLGMAMPVIQGTTTDSLPHRVSGRALSFVLCAVPGGGLIAGFIAAEVIPRFGWQSLFYIGSVIPLILIPMLYRVFPPKSIVTHSVAEPEASAEIESRLGPYRSLFTEGGRGLIILLTTVFFSSGLAYSLMSWTPALLIEKGLTTQAASVAGGILNGGAMVAFLAIGYLIDRKDPRAITIACYLLAAIFVVGLGSFSGSAQLMLSLAFLGGFFGVGAQVAMTYMLAHQVSPHLRVAVLGVAMIFSRTGASAAPFALGLLNQVGLGPAGLFNSIGGLSMIACAGVMVYSWSRRKRVPASKAG